MRASMNEEEIKIKYILPWLAEIGVRIDEIQLESTFSLRIPVTHEHLFQ